MLALLALGGATSAAAPPEWLRPSYHFTRLHNHMNDPVRSLSALSPCTHTLGPHPTSHLLPAAAAGLGLPCPSWGRGCGLPAAHSGGVAAAQNGLMWRRNAAGELDYHMYFQSHDPGQTGCSQWGHTVSHDLVHWKRMPRTPIRGSSGGGLALPPSFVPPPALAGAKAITINSAPTSPSLNPAVGLHLWYSTDDALLNWTEYRDPASVQSSTNQTCIICPELVPPEYNPGYIGDNVRAAAPFAVIFHTYV